MANEGVLQAHSLVVPNLDGLVPGSRHHNGGLCVREEFDLGYPISVGVLVHSELAFSNGVPDLDVVVSISAGNLPVVGREGNCESILCVAYKSLVSGTFL